MTNPGVAVTVDVLANDQDADGDTLSVSAYDAASTKGGSLVLNADNTLTYTPPSGYMGDDTFSYTVSDGRGGTGTATVSILVNTAPVAEDDVVTATVDTPITIYVLVNDHDANGDAFTVTGVDSPSDKGGTVVNNHDGTLTYTSPSGFIGTDGFHYTITDSNGGSGTAAVTVRVQAKLTPASTGSTGASSSGGVTDTGGGAVSWEGLIAMASLIPVVRSNRRRR